ncbi:MAG: hypothetical protein IIX06_07850 [Bacteroidales bacterium]|nr:hypothetical protein [Bacteroidales bacterium]
MKKIYRFFAIMTLLLTTMASKAQNDGIALTLLPHFSYNNMYNPAIPVESKRVIGVGISNVNFSVFNSSVRYNNLFTPNSDGSLSLDANKFINSLDEHDNFISSNFSMDVVRIGTRIGRLFVDFDYRVKFNGELHYSKDFLGFFVNGNGNYLGHDNPADFSIGADINLYSEMSLGLQYRITDKLYVGVRPKILIGMANLSVNDDGTKIYTDENTYEMTADINLNFEATTALDMDDIYRLGDYSRYFENMDTLIIENLFDIQENIGFGIDFGVAYEFNKHFGIAAGVYDLGYITWTDTKVKHCHKDNVVVNDALFKSIDDVMNMNIDFSELYTTMVEDVWGNDSVYDGADYKTSLKTRIMLQGYYQMNSLMRITAIGQMYYIKDEYRPALTLAYSGSFWRLLNFTASYTMSKYSGNSIGAGIGINLGPLNIYAITDNVMIATKYNASPMEMLTTFDAANIRLGLVLTFGNRR